MVDPGITPRVRALFALAWRPAAVALAVAIVVVLVTHWTRWEGEARFQTTNDAYLQADLTPISAKVSGYIRSMQVQDYDRVAAGQVIAEIVDDEYRAAVAQSEANVALAETQIRTLEAQRRLEAALVKGARAVLAATVAGLEQNHRDLQRARQLLATGSGSVETTERTATSRAQLLAQAEQNRAQIEAAERQLDVLTSQEAQARAALAAQSAALTLARINLGYTMIRAPQDGMISQRQVFPGEYVAVGTQLTTLAPLPHVWVIANYRETQLTNVRIGQRARVTVDTYPGHSLQGHVVALAPASGAQFALLPPDNATGNFTKIVQRFSVKIQLDDTAGLVARLRPGMSVIATIDSARQVTDGRQAKAQ
jgi:membrane fusion protein, multidrug efflux system